VNPTFSSIYILDIDFRKHAGELVLKGVLRAVGLFPVY